MTILILLGGTIGLIQVGERREGEKEESVYVCVIDVVEIRRDHCNG